MPEISIRNQRIVHSPIRSLVKYSRQAEEMGKRIYYLNIGQPDIHTPPEALAKINDYSDQIIKYGRSDGKESLRKAVAEYYRTFQVNITKDQVYVTTGASEAILFSLFSCFDPGDEIIVPEPFYANYLGYASVAGIEIKPISTFIHSNFSLPPVEEFTKCISPKTKAIFLCNPGNPTGQLYSEKDLRKLSSLIKQKNLYLIVDEVYREFCYEKEFYSVLRIDEIHDHVIVIDSISKVFSACGARIGFIVTKNQAILNAVDKLGQLRLSPPILGQTVAEECFKSYHEYILKVKNEYNKRRKVLYGHLKRIEGIRCFEPNAAFYIMAELPVDDAEKFCKWMLSDFDHNGETVMLAPGHGFYFNQDLGRKQVRIAYILEPEKIEIAMNCLNKALAIYQSDVMEWENLSSPIQIS